MDVITNNPIVYDTGILDESYENAVGRRRAPRGRRSAPKRKMSSRNQSQSSPSSAKRTSAGKPSSLASSGRNLTAQSSTPRNAPRPARNVPPNRTNPLQGKPNSIQQTVALTPGAPVPNNNKKIALVVGGVLLLGIAGYFYSKRNK